MSRNDRTASEEQDVDQPDAVATSHGSSPTKVVGEIGDTDATGVVGHATAGSSITYGVLGQGDSPSTQGVVGTTGSLPNIPTGFPAGVWAHTARSSADAGVTEGYGIYAESTAGSGETYGLYGIVKSPQGYGVYSDGNSHTKGNHEVTRDVSVGGDLSVGGNQTVIGSVSVGDLGASAHLSANVDIPDDTATTVPFDVETADDRYEFDTSTHTFTASRAGHYRVDVAVGWAEGFSDGDYHQVWIEQNGSVVAATTENHSTSDVIVPSTGLSKLVRGVSAGDTIEGVVKQVSGSTKSVVNSASRTYLDVVQVG